jgi:hypothetical protein
VAKIAKPRTSIEFQHKAIGQILAEQRLCVPIHQRSYRWEDEHITSLFQDFANAIIDDAPDYFLGTIVLTSDESETPEIADGQQRLATTSILLAAIRDYLYQNNNRKRADSITHTYLFETDLRTEEVVPRLSLNIDDKEFFRKKVLSLPDAQDRSTQSDRRSNKRIERAAQLAAEYVQNIVSQYKESDRTDRLVEWVEFIKSRATVILVTVPDSVNAYTIFETLNDRGLKIAQSDLLKNFLFGKSGDRLSEVQAKWAAMAGIIESVEAEDLTVTYIRHSWIAQHGPTTAAVLSKEIKGAITSKHKAIALATELGDGASDYAALFNPNHEKWSAYGNSTRRHIGVIVHHLRVEQIRPLMFAVGRHFTVPEGQKAFRAFVCWSVRFLVAGGRGGLLDRNYATAAQQVGTGAITTAAALTTSLANVIPTDEEFKAAFSAAWISKNFLARYYLRALEMCAKDDREPELIPNEDEDQLTLEHILPENPSSDWPIDHDTASALFRRIGNMVLLKASVNHKIGNVPFTEKKQAFAKSGLELTKMVARHRIWGQKEIGERQAKLAALAVVTWPISPK